MDHKECNQALNDMLVYQRDQQLIIQQLREALEDTVSVLEARLHIAQPAARERVDESVRRAKLAIALVS